MSATIKSSSDGNTTTIGTNGGDTLAINSTGNVGIGDTTPTDAKLQVYANSSTIAGMRVTQEGTGNAFEVYDDASDTTPFTIDNAGNVRIDSSVSIGTNLYVDGITVGYGNHKGTSNTAVGRFALDSNGAGGDYNTAIGNGTLQENLTGDYNTALGYGALNENNGAFNTAIGCDALKSNVIGGYNTAVGHNTLGTATNAVYNSVLGYAALQSATTDIDRNVGVGYGALLRAVSGTGNVAIGHAAGQDALNPMYNIYIGYDADSVYGHADNQIIIGKSARGLGSNSTVIGTAANTVTKLHGNVITNTGKFGNAERNDYIFCDASTDSIKLVSDDKLLLRVDSNVCELSGTSPRYVIIDTNAATKSDFMGYLAFHIKDGSTGNRVGWIGYGSSGTDTIYYTNQCDGGTHIMSVSSVNLDSGNVAQFGIKAADSYVNNLLVKTGIFNPAPTEALDVIGNIKVSGNINANALIQKSAVKTVAATLTVDEVVQGYIVTTGTTYNLTLPTGALFDTGYTTTFKTPLQIGDMVEFTIINNASGSVTLVVASGITDTSVGTLGVATNTVKRFFLRKTAANAFNLYAGA